MKMKLLFIFQIYHIYFLKKILLQNIIYLKVKSINYILCISLTSAIKFEKETISQSECDLWFQLREKRITSSICHSVFIRKRNHENLAQNILHPKPKSELPERTKEILKHGKTNEPKARDLYQDVMNLKLKRNIKVRETGIVIQPKFFGSLLRLMALLLMKTLTKNMA